MSPECERLNDSSPPASSGFPCGPATIRIASGDAPRYRASTSRTALAARARSPEPRRRTCTSSSGSSGGVVLMAVRLGTVSPTVSTRQRRLTAVMRSEDRVTPLALFFDLVFVLAITQCTALMAANTTWGGLGEGLRVLGLVWWGWVG